MTGGASSPMRAPAFWGGVVTAEVETVDADWAEVERTVPVNWAGMDGTGGATGRSSAARRDLMLRCLRATRFAGTVEEVEE